MVLTDEKGKAVQEYEYDSFGNMKDRKNKVKQPYAFTGREWDREAKLYFYRARYYDAGAGRFISRDPMGFEGGINRYVYVYGVGKPLTETNVYLYAGNNPINRIDSLGLWYIDINISLGYWVGGTGGVLINATGLYPYAGGGVMAPAPGGVAITFSPMNPSSGLNAGLQGGYWGGGQIGYGFGEGGGVFVEGGFVTPGGSLTGYYVWGPPSSPIQPLKCH